TAPVRGMRSRGRGFRLRVVRADGNAPGRSVLPGARGPPRRASYRCLARWRSNPLHQDAPRTTTHRPAISGMSGEKRVARAAGREEHEIIGDSRGGFQARELGFVDALDDRQRIVHFLSYARNRILVDCVFVTIGRVGHCVAPDVSIDIVRALAVTPGDVQRLNP